MVPNLTAILQRLTGEWAARLQPEAILAGGGEVGYPGWRDRVLTPVTTVQRATLDEARWHGHRPLLGDGSGGSMPDTPALQDAFGQPNVQRPWCGVPVARLLGLFHAGTGVLLKLVVAPLLTHDLAQVQAVPPS